MPTTKTIRPCGSDHPEGVQSDLDKEIRVEEDSLPNTQLPYTMPSAFGHGVVKSSQEEDKTWKTYGKTQSRDCHPFVGQPLWKKIWSYMS